MASVTRSTRRPEGLHAHDANGPLTRSAPHLFQHAGRTKRGIDASARDFDAIKPKKPRIAVEILSKRPAAPPVFASEIPPPRLVPTPVVAGVNGSAQQPLRPSSPPATKPVAQDQSLTKHQAKVINGIKHELDRLQPQAVDTNTKELGRKLRSQEATRFKSELSAYFPDYDEVIGNDPKEQHLFNTDTPIIISDSNPRRAPPSQARAAQAYPPYPITINDLPVRGYGDALYTDVFDAQRIDFGFLEAQNRSPLVEDPLPDSLFDPVHKRAERLERSIRNTEKGRAQHEKDQIIRLLEILQGHDWLRVMGVSGITETKKKAFEPARDYFIKGCQAILDKFRNWNLEEKRRKMEKDRALAELAEEERKSEEAEEQHASEAVEEDEEGGVDEAQDGDGTMEEDAASRDDTSEASSPAKQLREEAMARSKLAAKPSKKPKSAPIPTPPKPPEPPREFKSFYTKKYERDGALNRHRRAGRKVLAWGHPLPDITESEFDLPEEYRDEETLKARERRKRRDRRTSKQ